MSRVPRSQEHLKTGFTAEAVSAARFRAYAARAERDGKPNLARKWLELAAEKDALAILQLEAAGQVRAEAPNRGDATAAEQYDDGARCANLSRSVEDGAADVFEQVVSAQKETETALSGLAKSLQAATGDI